MGIAVDAASPVLATDANNGSSGVLATAAFNPPSKNTVLVACVCANGDAGVARTSTITNNGTALVWTVVALRNVADSGGQEAAALIAVAVLDAARTGMTVTSSLNSAGSNTVQALGLYVVTGANISRPVGGLSEGTSLVSPLNTTAFATKGTASLLFGSVSDYFDAGTITSSDMTVAPFINGDLDGATAFKALGAAGTNATANFQSGASPGFNWVTVEILAAPAAPPPQPYTARRRSANF